MTRRRQSHVWERYDVPFCPQLSSLDGDMITEWLGADPRRCGWSPARDRQRPRAWAPFLEEVRRRSPTHAVVKLQVTGPVTLAVALERERGATPSRRAALVLAQEIAIWLAANVGEPVRTLRGRGLDALLVVDEPAVRELGTLGLETVWDPLRAIAPAWGLHLCCRVPWGLVERAEPDLLSFDLTLEGLDEPAAGVIDRLTRRAGRVAWGAIAPHRREDVDSLVRRVRTAVQRTGIPPELMMLTPACGSGRVSIAREREIATQLDEVAARMRESEREQPSDLVRV